MIEVYIIRRSNKFEYYPDLRAVVKAGEAYHKASVKHLEGVDVCLHTKDAEGQSKAVWLRDQIVTSPRYDVELQTLGPWLRVVGEWTDGEGRKHRACTTTIGDGNIYQFHVMPEKA